MVRISAENRVITIDYDSTAAMSDAGQNLSENILAKKKHRYAFSYHVQYGLLDKGRAITELVVCRTFGHVILHFTPTRFVLDRT